MTDEIKELTQKERIELLLEVLAEGLVYIMANDDKNKDNSVKQNKPEWDLISFESHCKVWMSDLLPLYSEL